MSKRFTETEKWRDSWFRQLPYDAKMGYLYLIDSVDNAGVWDADFALANFCIGHEIDWCLVRQELGDRLEILPNSKWHLTRFIAFQYGELSPDCKPHAQVMRLCGSHGIRVNKGYSNSIHTPKDKDKEQDKDKDKDTAGRFSPPTPDQVSAYSTEIAYPLDGHAWCDSYAQKGWMVGKSKMKDWRAAVRNWKSNGWVPNKGSAGQSEFQNAW